MSKARKTEIFYDGSCSACRVFVDAVQSAEGDDAFDARDITKGHLPEGTSFTEAWKHMYVVTREGEKIHGGRALVHVLRETRKWRFLARMLSLPLIREVVDIAYSLLAPLRHHIRWQKGDR